MIYHWKDFTPKEGCLDNKIIAITGAGSGIGKTLAVSFASFGATVILIGRNIEKLEVVYDEIESNGFPKPAIVPIDLETAVEADYKSIADGIESTFNHLDGLIHNAAELGQRTSIGNYSFDIWDKLMRVNITAPFAMTKAFLPLLQQSNAGSILFTSSGVAPMGRAYWGAYAASKAAMDNLMRTLADELDGTSNIRSNSINPGATRTSMRADAYPAEDPATVKPAEDLIPLYTFFMSDESKDINGELIAFS